MFQDPECEREQGRGSAIPLCAPSSGLDIVAQGAGQHEIATLQTTAIESRLAWLI
jgi:hypothetical protein